MARQTAISGVSIQRWKISPAISEATTATGTNRQVGATPIRLAPAELGGYSLGAVKWLEGDYLTLRPSFEIRDAIFAYRTKIEWSGDHNCLCFHEAERLDAPFSQKGVVSMPNKSSRRPTV